MPASEPPPQEDGAAASGAAALPPDVLRHVFSFLLPPNDQPAPLLQVARAWHTLRRVCRAWADAAADMPVALDACVPLPAVLPWLHRHATALRLVPPPKSLSDRAGCSREQALQWVQDHCGPLTLDPGGQCSSELAAELTYEQFIRQLALARGRRSMFNYESSLFVPPGTEYRYSGDYQPLPMLQLADMRRLQVLDITCGSIDSFLVHSFDTEVLAQLTALRELTLRNFHEPCLWGVPRQLRVLRVLGSHYNDLMWHHPRHPRTFFSLPPAADRRLDLVELVGYNNEYSPILVITADHILKLFHEPYFFKVLLSSLCQHCQHVRTDAHVLFLGDPNPVPTTKRWVAPDHDLQVFASNDLGAAVEALARAVAAAQPPMLERLEIVAGAQLVLPCGALVSAALMAEPQGQRLLQERWPGLQVHMRQQAGDAGSEDWLLLMWPPHPRR